MWWMLVLAAAVGESYTAVKLAYYGELWGRARGGEPTAWMAAAAALPLWGAALCAGWSRRADLALGGVGGALLLWAAAGGCALLAALETAFSWGEVSGRRVLCLLGGCGAVVLLPAFGMDIPLGPVGALTPVLLLLGGVELTYRRELRRPPARALADGPLRGLRLWWRVGVLAVAAFLGGLFLCCGLSHLLGEGATSPLWAALFLGAPLSAPAAVCWGKLVRRGESARLAPFLLRLGWMGLLALPLSDLACRGESVYRFDASALLLWLLCLYALAALFWCLRLLRRRERSGAVLLTCRILCVCLPLCALLFFWLGLRRG